MSKRYHPSGLYEDGSLPALFGLSVLGGVMAGGAVWLIGNWIRLLIVFPALMGAGAGIGAILTVKSRRIRAPLLAAAAGLLGGLAGWGTVAIPGPRGGFFTVYILSPILGALAGAAVYQFLIRPGMPVAEAEREPDG